MPSIRTIQSRDVQSLADTFSNKDEDFFNMLYIDHLQDKSYALVVTDVDEDEDCIYLGYACVLWQSTVTHFWRRNIPEIIELIGSDDLRQQLLAQIEQVAIEHRAQKIGVCLSADTSSNLYEKQGYQHASFTPSLSNDMLLLIKKLA